MMSAARAHFLGEDSMTGEEGIALGWSSEVVPLHSYVSFYYSDEQTMRRSLAFLRACAEGGEVASPATPQGTTRQPSSSRR